MWKFNIQILYLTVLLIITCIIFQISVEKFSNPSPLEKAKAISNNKCDVLLKGFHPNKTCHVKSLINSNRLKTLGGNVCYLDNDPGFNKQDPMLKNKQCSISSPLFKDNKMFSKVENKIGAGFGDRIFNQKCVLTINPQQITKENSEKFNKALVENDHESCRKTYGLQFALYDGYFNDNIQWFKGKSATHTGFTKDFRSLAHATNNLITGHGAEHFSIQWNGFIRCKKSGLHRFYIGSDDASYLWLGYAALKPDKNNLVIDNGGTHSFKWTKLFLDLEEGDLYPIRIMYGENTGGNKFKMFFQMPDSNDRYYHDKNEEFFTPFPKTMDDIKDIPKHRREGFRYFIYNGYFADRTDWFINRKVIALGYSNDMRDLTRATRRFTYNDKTAHGLNHNKHDMFSVQWVGFFRAHQSGKHKFILQSDDASYFWIGYVALRGYNRYNAQVLNGGAHGRKKRVGYAHLEKGKTYPIRIQYGERTGGNNFTFASQEPNTNNTISFDKHNKYFLPSRDDTTEIDNLEKLIWNNYKGLPAWFYSS